MLTLALSDIATLATDVAMHGTIRASEIDGDEIFEMMVAIVIIVYNT